MAPSGQRARKVLWFLASAISVIALFVLEPPKRSKRGSPELYEDGGDPGPPAQPNPGFRSDPTPEADLPDAIDLMRQALESKSEAEASTTADDAEVERRRRWMASFPIEPRYDPTVRFDPEKLAEASGANNAFSDPGADQDYRNLVARHGFLAGFHQHPWRESGAFETFYHLMDSENLTGDTLSLASVFQDLVEFSESMAQDPSASMTYTSWIVDPASGQEVEVEQPVAYPNGTTRTWARQQEDMRESILSWLSDAAAWPERSAPLDSNEAIRILERLQTEIAPESLIELKSTAPIGFTFDQREEDRLEAGDRLLIN